MESAKMTATTHRPPALKLTKEEIMSAIRPILAIADRIKETHAAFRQYHSTLPRERDLTNGTLAGSIKAKYQVEVVEADLELYNIFASGGPLSMVGSAVDLSSGISKKRRENETPEQREYNRRIADLNT